MMQLKLQLNREALKLYGLPLSDVARKSVSMTADQVRHKPAFAATENFYSLCANIGYPVLK